MKNLLFIGDVVGKSGCDFLSEKIYGIKKENDIDITVINGENSAQGNGITRYSADMLLKMGADVITTEITALNAVIRSVFTMMII